jgi:NADH-quinone oxidoreductase subunit A
MTTLVGYMVLFTIVAIAFIFVHLMAGRFLRPVKPDPDKLTIYECGEPTIGSAWVQFDLRFYVVALLFVIFDVEVAFFFPWAVVFGQANWIAKADATQDPARVVAAKQELKLPGPPKEISNQNKQVASDIALLAFIDIAVFFGVLLVGFAYLWRRGDLDWVRSIAAERAPPPAEAAAPVPSSEMVTTGPVS